MKERPILFSAPMVRAILEGRKTQTRRVVKPQCHPFGDMLTANEVALEFSSGTRSVRCPYGQPGDRLWVKETYMPDPPRDRTWCSVAWEDDKRLDGIPERFQISKHVIFRASWDGIELGGWKPSIHMPRWASRITLEITGVRVERLNEISILDSHAEGVGGTYGETGISLGFPGLNHEWDNKTAVEQYQWLWESINGPGSWDLNPWVWVVEFKGIKP